MVNCVKILMKCSVAQPLFAYFSAWLTSYEDPVVEKINQRIEDITGLEVDTAEELQVKSLNSS